MNTFGPSPFRAALLASALAAFATAGTASAAPHSSTAAPASVEAAAPLQVAQYEGAEPRDLQPRYEPGEPEPRGNYNDQYIFGLTRGVADSTMHPAAKILIFPITVPLDFALLPFEVMGGFF